MPLRGKGGRSRRVDYAESCGAVRGTLNRIYRESYEASADRQAEPVR